jgi:DNA-binding LacI/PurR family transcriptional regulator
MKITIREIAKEANVSVATVSRCINNKGYVHEETKKIVNSTRTAVKDVSIENARKRRSNVLIYYLLYEFYFIKNRCFCQTFSHM